jgi:hypothetical protein
LETSVSVNLANRKIIVLAQQRKEGRYHPARFKLNQQDYLLKLKGETLFSNEKL